MRGGGFIGGVVDVLVFFWVYFVGGIGVVFFLVYCCCVVFGFLL